MKIAIIGGSGKLGLGCATRLLHGTHQVVIASRDIAKAREAAARLGGAIQPMSNESGAAWCDVAILTVPYAAHRIIVAALKDALAGKIVIDATVPLNYENIFQMNTESGKSAAEESHAILEKAHVFAGFQTISHRTLRKAEHVEDVLIAGPSNRKPEVMQLVRDMNLRPIDTGPLEAAALLERMTALLISINKQNNSKDAGLKVTGI